MSCEHRLAETHRRVYESETIVHGKVTYAASQSYVQMRCEISGQAIKFHAPNDDLDKLVADPRGFLFCDGVTTAWLQFDNVCAGKDLDGSERSKP